MTQLLEKATDILFGCWHENYTFPQTREVSGKKFTYVCCLSCGREFPYEVKPVWRKQ